MEFSPLSTQNWSRTFSVWIEDIQVQFQPVVRITLRGGFLRRVRGITRVSAGLVTLFFLLHCSKPRVSVLPRQDQDPSNALDAIPEGPGETGAASWYGGKADRLVGEKTANGERLDPSALTCAHRTLPLGSFLQVENLENGRKVMLRINDRGPFIRGRIVDVTRKAAQELGFTEKGLATVRIRPARAIGSQASTLTQPKDNPLTIQVAALSDPVNIERLSKDLSASFGDVVLQSTADRDGRPMKRIQVGSYATMEEAERASNEIAKRFGDRGVEPFITRRR